jgi:streptogramin lyase
MSLIPFGTVRMRIVTVPLAIACMVSSLYAATIRGTIQSGGTSVSVPLRNVNVALFEATTGTPSVLAQARSDSFGHFLITSPKESSASIFFMTADVGVGVQFSAVLGPNLPPSVTMNELTTVAASYSMAQFYRTGVISGNSFGLRIAAGMNNNLVAVTTGSSSQVLLNSPNADETNSLRMTRTLANVLVACVNSRGATAELLALTKPARGRPPRNTADALANLARDPGQNVRQISPLAKLYSYYSPALESVPDAWTVTVKLNDSGDDTQLIGGPGNLVFDADGYAWITNNVVQSTTGSSKTMILLKPNGQPSDGSNSKARSPVTGGGLLGGGYGITIDPQGFVWEGNFGWGDDNPTLDGNGSISEFSAFGVPISGPEGYQGGPLRAQGMVADASGNIWIASFANDSVFVFPGGDPSNAIQFQQYAGSGPFGVALAPDGTVWVSNGLVGVKPNSLAKYELRNGVLHQKVLLKPFGRELRGLSVDSRGNAWVTSQGESVVYAVAPDGKVLGRFTGGGINGPWGTSVDGDDNIWVANFGPLQAGSNFTAGRLSELCGVNTATCPPGTHMGQPISPGTGYTVPSAGSQVLLHNGDPLYGPGAPPSFAPMMRQTSSLVDAAGNVWTLNNWKPAFDVDAVANPGGDGAIIFVGIAKPPSRGN